jgi:hypothetical protein
VNGKEKLPPASSGIGRNPLPSGWMTNSDALPNGPLTLANRIWRPSGDQWASPLSWELARP